MVTEAEHGMTLRSRSCYESEILAVKPAQQQNFLQVAYHVKIKINTVRLIIL
jgi:hypothetical protein